MPRSSDNAVIYLQVVGRVFRGCVRVLSLVIKAYRLTSTAFIMQLAYRLIPPFVTRPQRRVALVA
jgi:hypothetical protein